MVNDRFKKALVPAMVMGLATNIYIFSFQLWVEAYSALFSPVIGSFVFIYCFYLLKATETSTKAIFLFSAYTVAAEVYIHTYFFGWDCGFFYFMFLLPIVFLLNASWKTWMVIFFNTSIILSTIVLWFIFRKTPGIHFVLEDIESNINLINVSGTALVIFVIIVYFSRTIHKKEAEIMAANRALEFQNEEISQQHQNLQTLLKEIHHRVKNNLQIISSLMSLQSRAVNDAEVLAVLNESKRRIESIALVHEKLYKDDNVDRVDFKSYLHEIVDSQQIMTPHIKCRVISEEIALNIDIAVPLGLIVSEIVINAVKHAFNDTPHPELVVSQFSEGDSIAVVVKDNGVGLPPDFNLDDPQSLGLEIITALVDQINGEIVYANDEGARFKITFKDKN